MKCGHLLLRDTRGNFYLGIKLPTREYKPTEGHKRAQKKWRIKNPHYHTNYSRNWKKRLPIDKKEYYRIQKNEYMKGYYERNRDRIIEYSKQYYHKKVRKQKRLKERTHSSN
jgi:hypothetical protein